MAFQSQAGKKFNSKFRANRADKAAQEGMESQSEPKEPKPTNTGNRAQAAAIEGKKGKVMPGGAEGAGDGGGPVNSQGAGQPAMAREVHITHDHANGMHHVHTVNEDGTEMHSDHATADEAHVAGAAAGGVNPDGNYPAEHKDPTSHDEPDEDDYAVKSLDEED